MSSDNMAKLIEDKLEASLQGFKTSLLNEVKTAVATSCKTFIEEDFNKAAKRVKVEEKPEFKRSYNKDQFNVNEKVLSAINDAENALASGNRDEVQKMLEEGKKILLQRQKHIRIADREDCGWDVIKHYTSDVLADNSDDEKRILRSRRQALSEKKEKLSKQKKDLDRKRRSSNKTVYPYKL